MFTGLVEDVGKVVAFASAKEGWSLQLLAPRIAAEVALGDSVAVNGCCLTAVRAEAGHLWFDVLAETRRLTNFSELQPGAAVNLERSLRVDARIDGHFVSGHIDALGTVESLEPRGQDYHLQVRLPAEFSRYLVYKGSVAIDGISLTVAEVTGDRFAVWLIPHTMAVTNLREKTKGAGMNLEFDLLAKYVEKLLQAKAVPTA